MILLLPLYETGPYTFGVLNERLVQLGLQLPNAFCMVKLQTCKNFLQIRQKSQDHTVKGGQYTAQGTIKTIF